MKYLTYEERIRIEALNNAKVPVAQIARQLGRCLKTIYNELKRGEVTQLDSNLREYKSYSADKAQQKHEYAQTSKGRPLKIGCDMAFACYIEHKIKEERYSPAAALAAARRLGRFDTDISINTLYGYIYKGYIGISPRDLLRCHPKKRREPPTAPKVKEAPSISQRPEHINARSDLGHWEMDCVCSGRGSTAALLTLTERTSRYELIFKIPNKKTETIVKVINRLEKWLGSDFPRVFQSITVDNGSEFRDYDGMRLSRSGQIRTEIYYCHPYRSGERGTNENHNGIIRRWFPKGIDFAKITRQQVNKVQEWMNNYPRAVLGWCCPADLLAFPVLC